MSKRVMFVASFQKASLKYLVSGNFQDQSQPCYFSLVTDCIFIDLVEDPLSHHKVINGANAATVPPFTKVMTSSVTAI